MSSKTAKNTRARKGRATDKTKAPATEVATVVPSYDELLAKMSKARVQYLAICDALTAHPEDKARGAKAAAAAAAARAANERAEKRAEDAARRVNERLTVYARNPLQYVESWRGPETDVSETLHNVYCAMNYLNGLQPSESEPTGDDELGRVLIQETFLQAIKACRDELRARHEASRNANAKAKGMQS